MQESRSPRASLMAAMAIAMMGAGALQLPAPRRHRETPEPPQRRRKVAVEQATDALMREIAAHNEAVEQRKLAKKLAKLRR
jgi:hypothetical protein